MAGWRDRLAGWLDLATRRDVDELRERMEKFMDETADQLWEKVGARAAALMAELNSSRATIVQLTEALGLAKVALDEQQTGETTRTQAAVAEALTLQGVKDIDRARGLLAALGGEMPVDVPETPPTPPAGEPAEIPTTPSGVEVAPVDESALPTSDPQTGAVSDGSTTPSSGEAVADAPVPPLVDGGDQVSPDA